MAGQRPSPSAAVTSAASPRDDVRCPEQCVVGDTRYRTSVLPIGQESLAENALADPEDVAGNRRFEESWCDELLARAWAALAEISCSTGQPYYAVLRFRADHPDVRSPQMAEQIAARLGRTFTAAGIRQILHRAREKFAGLLLDEVTHSLDCPTAEQLEQELVELGFLDYCRPALERHALKA